LSAALQHRHAVLGGVLCLFLGALALIPFIGREFFPHVDAGQITIYLRSLQYAPGRPRLDIEAELVDEPIPLSAALLPDAVAV
jgi:hypothetical protein